MTHVQTSSFLINRIVDQMTQFLTEDYHLDIPTALNVVYNSKTLSLLQNKATELYIESPSYVYELLKKEYQTGKLN
ncbi:MAG TPA: hypothetical protein DEQ17_04430 [Prevotella sp.]|nr:hypothetical protein [Prevotella sp.]